jgi:VWFA-related protein
MRLRTRVAGLLAWLAVGVTAAQAPLSPQGPTPTFRAQVEYVEVDALVTDQRGNVVRDLTKEDFRVFEDGRPQTISSFDFVDIPIEDAAAASLASSRPIDTDTQSNERPVGRLYVLIVDVLHVRFERTPRVWAAARQFIERNLGADDRMAVISTGGRSEDAQDFTSDKRLLMESVDRFAGEGRDAGTAARDEQIDAVQRAEMLLETLRHTAEWFGGVHGRRKTILLFSEGIDFEMTSPGVGAAAVMNELFNTVATIGRANVSIYAVDPRGLTAAGNTIELGALEPRGALLIAPPRQAGSAGGQVASPMPPASPQGALDQVREQLRVSQRNLRSLADDTGGFAALNSNDYTGAFERIVRDNSSYYVLA